MREYPAMAEEKSGQAVIDFVCRDVVGVGIASRDLERLLRESFHVYNPKVDGSLC